MMPLFPNQGDITNLINDAIDELNIDGRGYITEDFVNDLLANTCFNCVSLNPTDTAFNVFNAVVYCAVPLAIVDISFTVLSAVPKLLA